MKKFLALLISLSVLLMCVPGISLVASAAEIDDETFLTLTKENFQTKNGTATNAGKEANPYLITSTDEYRAVFDKKSSLFVSGNYVSGYFEIPADTVITLVYDAATGKGYVPNDKKPLSGGLEGNGNTITLSLGSSTNPISLDSNYKYAAAIAATMGGTIQNLNVEGNIFTTCSQSSTSGYAAAGVVGSATSTAEILNCVSDVEIKNAAGADVAVGGIVGNVKGITIKNCINNADRPITAGRSGGIVGSSSADTTGVVTIENCVNYGDGAFTGGIVGGMLLSFNITKCANYGILTTYNAGGIAGVMYNGNTNVISIDQCINAGQITQGAAFVGKAIYASGSGARAAAVNITNSYNTADINGQGNYGPGSFICNGDAAGSTKPSTLTVNISKCYNLGRRNKNGVYSAVQELVLPDSRGTATSGQEAIFSIDKASIYTLNNNSLKTATGATGAFLKTIPENWSTEIWEIPSEGYPYIQLKANKIDTTNANVAAIVESTTVTVTRGTTVTSTATAEDADLLANVKNASGDVTPITEGMVYSLIAVRMPMMVGNYEYGIVVSTTINNDTLNAENADKIFRAVRKDAAGNFAVLVYGAEANKTHYFKPYVKVGDTYYYGSYASFTTPALAE